MHVRLVAQILDRKPGSAERHIKKRVCDRAIWLMLLENCMFDEEICWQLSPSLFLIPSPLAIARFIERDAVFGGRGGAFESSVFKTVSSVYPVYFAFLRLGLETRVFTLLIVGGKSWREVKCNKKERFSGRYKAFSFVIFHRVFADIETFRDFTIFSDIIFFRSEARYLYVLAVGGSVATYILKSVKF